MHPGALWATPWPWSGTLS
uniref:Proline/histidine/glycine-rich 1 n=1 Tax=Mus musculus TaxID=10090 RepID=A0ABA7HCJ6_MOUSE